jgi:hypothetical protein
MVVPEEANGFPLAQVSALSSTNFEYSQRNDRMTDDGRDKKLAYAETARTYFLSY